MNKFLEDFSVRWYKLFPYSTVKCEDINYYNTFTLMVSMFIRGNMYNYKYMVPQEFLNDPRDDILEHVLRNASQEFSNFIIGN